MAMANHVSAPLCLVHVVGARPNFVKMAPIVHELRAEAPHGRQVLVHTGQHYDPEMAEIFLRELGFPEPDHLLGVGSGPHGAQTGRALERTEAVLERERPDAVLVAGDVNSTLAGALAAAKLGIPVGHVEAGLRSFDRTMPEEINRVLVDQISDWCFTHSPEAERNLGAEGVPSGRVFPIGNTMIDTLVRMRPRIERSDVHRRLGIARRRYILVTLHRPTLVDGPLFETVLARLAAVSRHVPIVFPLHPRAQARLPEGVRSTDPLRLVPPLGYIDFLALEAHAAGVITDSGGVQEETTFLRVPCFTLRENTERPVTVTHGTNRLLGLDPDALLDVPALLEQTAAPIAPPPGWDGEAGKRAARVLLDHLAVAENGRRQPLVAETAVS
jgi:UDP-N-acetylglucosamine 2-epimerase (non-hydrolysing)